MPDLGSILNRPVPALSIGDVRRCAGWLMEGLRQAAPKALLKLCWRRAYLLHHERDGTARTDLVEKSLFGEFRLAGSPGKKREAPNLHCVHPSKVFVTDLTLPMAAKPHMEKAIRVRIDELCPINQEEVAIAWSLKKESRSEIRVAIAFIRHETIEKIDKTHQDRAVGIAAYARDDGAVSFLFRPVSRTLRARIREQVLPIGLVFTGLFFLLAGLHDYAARERSKLERYEAELLAELRHLAIQNKDISEIVSVPSARAGEVLSSLDSLAALLPVSARLSQVGVRGNIMRLEGYIPEKEQAQVPFETRHRTDRSGYDRFILNLPLEVAE